MTLKHTYEAKTNIQLRPAWRRKDPVIERDAKLFWRAEQLLRATADLEARVAELCLAAYDGDTLIGLTTARVRYIGFLGVKLAMLRVAVASDKRKYRVASILQPESRELLEQWSAANPAEEVLGMGTVVQARMFGPDTRRRPSDPLRASASLAGQPTANRCGSLGSSTRRYLFDDQMSRLGRLTSSVLNHIRVPRGTFRSGLLKARLGPLSQRQPRIN